MRFLLFYANHNSRKYILNHSRNCPFYSIFSWTFPVFTDDISRYLARWGGGGGPPPPPPPQKKKNKKILLIKKKKIIKKKKKKKKQQIKKKKK
ncbi:hypothetical protein ACE18R_07885, partial [Escherichia fergusonii]|uniref:hypothetical protein n=1 Tax=Escherichia fergusonii TaxID=564 RepID=UPI0035C2196B